MEALQTLGGSAALLKAHTTRVLEYCQREASQIFGGKSFTRGILSIDILSFGLFLLVRGTRRKS
jgi:hypothetical protein